MGKSTGNSGLDSTLLRVRVLVLTAYSTFVPQESRSLQVDAQIIDVLYSYSWTCIKNQAIILIRAWRCVASFVYEFVVLLVLVFCLFFPDRKSALVVQWTFSAHPFVIIESDGRNFRYQKEKEEGEKMGEEGWIESSQHRAIITEYRGGHLCFQTLRPIYRSCMHNAHSK